MSTEQINQLRSEVLDHRAASLNRWLAAMSLLLSIVVVIATLGGFFGLKAVSNGVNTVNDRAKEAVESAKRIQLLVKEVEILAQEAEIKKSKIDDLEREAKATFGVALDEVLRPSQPRKTEVSGADGSSNRAAETYALEQLLFATEGYRPLGDTWSGSLSDMSSTSRDFNLSAGQSYWFAGQCDENCSDLDLAITDNDGRVLDKDELTDDVPMVSYDAKDAIEATLEVTMFQCNEKDCGWELRGYIRETTSVDDQGSQM